MPASRSRLCARLGWLAYFLLSCRESCWNVIQERERTVMDALDEFFRTWSEPEAWCEHCGLHPAIHVVVQDTQDAFESVVTYVRIWDPHAQSHVAVCRKCSIAHLETLKIPLVALSNTPSFWQRCYDRHIALRRTIAQMVQRATQYLRQWLTLHSRRQPVQPNQTDTDNCTHSGT